MVSAVTSMRVPEFLLVAAGGAIGAVCRWLMVSAVGNGTLQGHLPTGTLVVNLVGCVAAGLLLAMIERFGWQSEALRAFALVGVLGGFTTFSAFGVETMELIRRGAFGAAIGYVTASVVGGIGLAMIAYALTSPKPFFVGVTS